MSLSVSKLSLFEMAHLCHKGSPMPPVLANLFMEKLDTTAITTAPEEQNQGYERDM